ncbi:DUF5825 family protein [Streptomyces sp. NBC_01465]|uniref:DUF5825 family protein n=1 Tax=Streptomyces sp. NBC_01465 TaxID=2903878 RepID=UPI002E3292D8|nr:DUF5825 family protein [Streptomyces sp. NBC_01465]
MTALLPAAVPHTVTGRRVRVREPLPLAGGGRGAAVSVQFLRECQSHALAVDWVPDGAADTAPLHHLPPPAPLPDEPPALTDWRSRHAYGLLYHRRGPDFVTVMDRRESSASARFTLAHPELLAAFLTLAEPTPLDGLSAVHRKAASVLAAERLVLVTDGWAVALPPRLRQWPVPCAAI